MHLDWGSDWSVWSGLLWRYQSLLWRYQCLGFGLHSKILNFSIPECTHIATQWFTVSLLLVLVTVSGKCLYMWNIQGAYTIPCIWQWAIRVWSVEGGGDDTWLDLIKRAVAESNVLPVLIPEPGWYWYIECMESGMSSKLERGWWRRPLTQP